ncbi:hypothetical protein Tco_1195885, partial [Tanacetum coccineum]
DLDETMIWYNLKKTYVELIRCFYIVNCIFTSWLSSLIGCRYLFLRGTHTIDGDNLQEVFGSDKRERPAGKQRAVKKQKSVETSRSTGGSQSESVSPLVSQDYRRKCDAAKRAYEAQREKDLAIKKCEEMKFLMIDTSNLPPHKRAFIEKQQAEIMKKYEDVGADD